MHVEPSAHICVQDALEQANSNCLLLMSIIKSRFLLHLHMSSGLNFFSFSTKLKTSYVVSCCCISTGI
jgi:hypothetical protein